MALRKLFTAALLAAALGACRASQAPTPPEVRVHTTMSDLAADVLVQTARARGLAVVRIVASPAEAEVVWVRDPSEVLALGDRVAPRTLPPHTEVDARFLDPSGRFLPVCARARVLVVNPRAGLPFEPRSLRDLADPRVAGRVAVPAMTSEEGASTIAALTLNFGNASVSKFLAALARNEPIVVASDAEVRARVASGAAAFGVTSSEAAAAGAASAAGLEVVLPDQDGRPGAILLPTAVALVRGAPETATRLAHWLASAEAEQVLVARLPGLMPLRSGVPVPVGVQPTIAVRAALIDWDRFAAEKEKVRSALQGWPDQWRR